MASSHDEDILKENIVKQEIIHFDKQGIMTDIYDGIPPGNYTCNRCGRKGHFLQACPTNLYPSYDKPPHKTYICEICDAEGQHWKSICPYNKDPYSINQQRKKRGIQPLPDLFDDNDNSRWERENEPKRERGIDPDTYRYEQERGYEPSNARKKIKTTGYYDDYYDERESYGRLSREVFDLDFDMEDRNDVKMQMERYSKTGKELNSNSAKKVKVEKMEKLKEITTARSTIVRECSEEIDAQVRDGIINGRVVKSYLNDEQEYAGQRTSVKFDARNGIEENYARKSGDRDRLNTKENFKPTGSSSGPHSLATMRPSTVIKKEIETGTYNDQEVQMTDDAPRVRNRASKEFPDYSPFVLDLMKRNPKMMEKVNHAPKRKTALICGLTCRSV